MIHKPHGWVILKFTSKEKVYFKIFASWRGGYLDGDSWRLSSGSRIPPEISECGNYWIWLQESGSTYQLPFLGEGGTSVYTENVLNDILRQEKRSGINIEKMNIREINKY
ncbi:hypothetical protein AAEU32_10255 [Pseudoalteromonas sp. SSDWG2]|uniref:hypothetical protein n=1 Tax=Pseudoalteromonas sp. SSDWG2 TaxID=3139391 RepID=UPI003BA89759